MKSIKDNVELVNVEITNKSCMKIGLKSKRDYSYYEFNFNDKTFRKNIYKDDCLNISLGDKIELLYYSQTEEFFPLELINENYYKKFIYFLGAILLIALIPYKLLLKK